MYSTGYGYSNSSRLIEIGPQSAGGEEGGADCAEASPENETVISDSRDTQTSKPEERLEFLMIPPYLDKLYESNNSIHGNMANKCL